MSAIKEGVSREPSADMSETLDAMMWANTWEMMNRTLEAVATIIQSRVIEEEPDTADEFFEILLNRFGSRLKGHQAMMRFEKKRQRNDESIDQVLDDLESLRRKSDPEESTNRRNFSFASKVIDAVKSDDLRTMLATYYTLLKDNATIPEEMRQKSREYMLMKPKKNSISGNWKGEANSKGHHSATQEMKWTSESHVQIVARLINSKIGSGMSK